MEPKLDASVMEPFWKKTRSSALDRNGLALALAGTLEFDRLDGNLARFGGEVEVGDEAALLEIARRGPKAMPEAGEPASRID